MPDGISNAISYQILGDATTSECIAKSKVYVAKLTSVRVSTVDGPIDSASATLICPIQVVQYGTSAETYCLLRENIRSSGADDWATSALTDSKSTAKFYQFGLDNGGDNVPIPRMVRNAIQDSLSTMFTVVWCMFHQGHLLAGNMLSIADNWVWTSAWPVQFITGLSQVAGQWGSYGIPRKLYDTACEFYGATIAEKEFRLIPPKLYRGRWLNVDDCEAKLLVEDLP